jgi:hypothetical protein
MTPEWLPLLDAVALAAADHGLSVGAAQKALRQAGASGEVRTTGIGLMGNRCDLTPADWCNCQIDFNAGVFDEFGGLLDKTVLGKTVQVALGKTVQVTVSAADLRPWLARHYKPAAAPRTLPIDQATLNDALLTHARSQGKRLKQKYDTAGRNILWEIGATTRQITIAYRNLPEEFRFGRGNPGK